MKTIVASVHNAREDVWQNIDLPASYKEILEIIETLGIEPLEKTSNVHCFEGDYNLFNGVELEDCNIYELNHFANTLVEMDDYEFQMFTAIRKTNFLDDTISINDAINIALNVEINNSVFVPVSDDEKLGDFYFSNQLVPELKEVSEELYQWMSKNADFTKIGESMRESEKGVFTDRGYIVMNEELQPLYDGKYPTPAPADYVFKLEITKSPTVENLANEPKEEELVELKLPATKERYMEVIKSTVAANPSDCVFYRFTSAIPQLDGLWEFLDDLIEIESLNNLAMKIATMKQFNELTKYKAMLSTIDKTDIDLDIALNTFDLMREFELNATITESSEFALLKLNKMDKAISDELIDHINLESYGEWIMGNDGIEKTPYGMLISNDGMTFLEKIEQPQPTSPTMTMG